MKINNKYFYIGPPRCGIQNDDRLEIVITLPKNGGTIRYLGDRHKRFMITYDQYVNHIQQRGFSYFRYDVTDLDSIPTWKGGKKKNG